MKQDKIRETGNKSIGKYISIFLFSNILSAFFILIFAGEGNPILNGIVTDLTTILFLVIFCRNEIMELFYCSHLKNRLTVKTIMLLIGTGVSYNFIISNIDNITKIYNYFPDSKIYEEFLNSIDYQGSKFFIIFLFIGIVGPIVEEIIFRGLILQELKNRVNVIMAVLIESFLFGIFHMNLYQGFYASIFGIFVSVFYIWSGSIIVPIIIHTSSNISTLFLKNISIYSIEKNSVMLLLFLNTIFIMIAIFYFYAIFRKQED